VALGWTGVVAIISCGIVLQVSRVFPGYAALWPTLAAVFIITAGTSGSRFGADRLLASRPMVYLGGISYGIYLWHFPILAFARQFAQPYDLPRSAGVAILALSIGLAALTTRYIESQIREPRGQTAARGRPFVFGLACLAPVVIALGIWSAWYMAVKHPKPTVAAVKRSDHPGALARTSGFQYSGAHAVDVVPGPLQVAEDRESLDQPGCVSEPEATEPGVCRIAGSATGNGKRLTIAVVGGSHSSQWLPALKLIAEPSGWDVFSFTKSNCPFYVGASGVSEKEVGSCQRWNQNVMQALLKLRPDAVFMTSTRYNDDADDEFVPDGYINAWHQLAAAHIKVIALRDNPDFEFDVSACVELHGADSPLCALPRHRMLEIPSPTELIPNPPATVRFIDLSDYFCDGQVCPPVIGNVLVYRHMNHITATYVRTLAPMLQSELQRALEGDTGT
jgi:hypothetical protein